MREPIFERLIARDKKILADLTIQLERFESGALTLYHNREDVTEDYKADLRRRIAEFETLVKELELQYPA